MRPGFALVAAAVLLTAAAAGAHDPPARAASPLSATPHLPVIRQAPPLALVDPSGDSVRLEALRGHVVLVSFLYTRCTGACPLIAAKLALVQAALGARDRVRLLTVTVDPERDDAAALADYARRFGANARHWTFLRGDADRVAAVLGDWDEWTRRRANGDIDHPARLHLVDGEGRVREIYALEFFDERQALIDIRALLKQGAPRTR
jgi:protein SCO1/2